MTAKQDAILEAIWEALQRWDEAERQARDLRSITKADVRRVDRSPDGSHIPTPRRNALARYLTDAVLTALREFTAESESARDALAAALHRWQRHPEVPVSGCPWGDLDEAGADNIIAAEPRLSLSAQPSEPGETVLDVERLARAIESYPPPELGAGRKSWMRADSRDAEAIAREYAATHPSKEETVVEP